MNELKVLVSELTLEQFIEAFCFCSGISIGIHIVIDFLFLVVPLIYFMRDKQ